MNQVMKKLLLLADRIRKYCSKSVLFALCFLPIILYACESDKADSEEIPEITKSSFTIHKGVNIGNWLSQSDVFGTERAKAFTEAHVKKLASYGFDHIRLPVDEEHLFNENGVMDMETMQLVHNVIDWCRMAGIKVLFDLHIVRSHNFGNEINPLWNDPKEQDKLADLWAKITNQLEKYPESLVAYELLNEPIAPSNSQWNALSARLIKQIREKNKNRVIVLGSNQWSGVGTVNQLSVPENDPNIILEFHCYEPYLLTHYQASWSVFAKLNLNSDMNYPGYLFSNEVYSALSDDDKQLVNPYRGEYSKSAILEQWKAAIAFAKSKGLQLYCGEFGCLETAGAKNRIAWTKDIVSLCRENDIAYAYWEYYGIFGFANKDGFVHNAELLDCLIK